jgi:hypothetical protein
MSRVQFFAGTFLLDTMPTQASYQSVPQALSPQVKQSEYDAIHHHPMLRLKICGALPSLIHTFKKHYLDKVMLVN